MQPSLSPPSFRRLIGISTAARFLVDVSAQIFNPFLPILAAGVGMSVVQLGQLIGLRNAMGLFAPVTGALADRFGYQRVIRMALLTLAASFLLLAFSTAPWMVVLALALCGLGFGAFVPNLHAFVSNQLPYHQRARGLGMIEYAWALTGILGLSLIGLLIEQAGWRTPFLLLAIGMVAMNFVFATLPDHRRHQGPHATAQGLNALLLPPGNRRSTYATMLAGALSYCAAMQIMLSYGAWLADQYQLGAAALGTVAFVLGWFDLIASVSVSVFTDRIGKRRSMLIGVAGSLVGYLLMPLLNLALLPAVAIIGVTRCFFEFSIVSHLPLLSEQMPAHRGKVMSLGAALSLGSSTVAAFSGPWLLVNLGVAALAWSSAALVLLSLLTILFLVRETPEIP